MRILVNTEILNLTVPANNTITGNTRYLEGTLEQVLVKGPSESALFDIKITNNQSIDIYELQQAEGVISKGGIADVVSKIPVLGIYTITLDNATVGAYIIELMTVA